MRAATCRCGRGCFASPTTSASRRCAGGAPTTELADDLPAFATTEERHAEREELRQLERDLAELPERQRSALVLRELSGLSHDEIAPSSA